MKEATDKFDGAENFIKNRIDETYSQEKITGEQGIHVLVSFLQFLFLC